MSYFTWFHLYMENCECRGNFQGKTRRNQPAWRRLAYLACCQVALATDRLHPPEGDGARHPRFAKLALPHHWSAVSLSQATTAVETKSVRHGQLKEITQRLCSTSTSKWHGWHMENVTPTWGTAPRSKQEPLDQKAVASSGTRHFGHGARHSSELS